MTKLPTRQEEIEGLKNMVDELRMENCNRVADLICKEIARLEEEKRTN
jgi:hypothetical protein